MKVFIPMSDAALECDGGLYPRLVPFDPSFLTADQERSEGRKPSNWISESDCEQARERLYTAHA
ncbi:MAG: hypothetical protein HOC70_03085 [Gammaproteobacteria bacterium]|jgi:hypothetical protein|nr:hypothetical protein [Gammaproteobacteria bacterium]MBT4492200.1 hypothetical protein [Gammaproteobacteria bacterium]MBT7369852.1 hypothetical protein [Gammaproteobacteria bacterium]